jgi:hypothetical protein
LSSVDFPTPFAPCIEMSLEFQWIRSIIALTMSREVLAIKLSCFANNKSMTFSILPQKHKIVGYRQHFWQNTVG